MFESNKLATAFDKQLEIYRDNEDAAKALLDVGEAIKDTAVDAPEHAALTAVCLGIMNLDEALTRE